MEIEINNSIELRNTINKLFEADEFEKAIILKTDKLGRVLNSIILTNHNIYVSKSMQETADNINNLESKNLQNKTTCKFTIDKIKLNDVKYIKFIIKSKEIELCLFNKSINSKISILFDINNYNEVENFCQHISELVVLEIEKIPGIKLSYNLNSIYKKNLPSTSSNPKIENFFQSSVQNNPIMTNTVMNNATKTKDQKNSVLDASENINKSNRNDKQLPLDNKNLASKEIINNQEVSKPEIKSFVNTNSIANQDSYLVKTQIASDSTTNKSEIFNNYSNISKNNHSVKNLENNSENTQKNTNNLYNNIERLELQKENVNITNFTQTNDINLVNEKINEVESFSWKYNVICTLFSIIIGHLWYRFFIKDK